ncbi:MAG: tetratricopeptide repeat protein [bacterium]|nr:tetratricopeptide repeat protein [bacterium]
MPRLLAIFNKNKNAFILALFFVLVFLIYGKTISGDFVFDDRYVANSSQIFQLENFGNIITSPYWSTESGLYRPITLVSYAINYSIFGAKPWNFHLVNLILYAWACCLIFIFVKRLTKQELLGFLSALIFLVLPIHSEAVANIIGRAEILALFFSLLFLLEILKEKPKIALAGLWLLLALGSKENAVVVIPLGIILFLQKNTNLKYKDGLLAFWGAFLYFGARLQVLGWNYFSSLETSIVENPLKFEPLVPRVATSFKVLAMYLQKTLWPFNLCSDYSYNQIPVLKNFANISALIGFAIFIMSVALIFIFWKRVPIISFSAAIFVFGFLITSNIFFTTGTIAGERLMYYPSLGLAIILAYLLMLLIKRNSQIKMIVCTLTILLIIFYSWQSHIRSLDWLTEKNLFISAAKCAPNSVLSRSNLGAMLYQAGDLENAEKELVLAEKIYNGYPKGLNNLGLVYWKKGEKEKAKTYFLKALDFKFPYPGAYENLALMALESGNIKETRKWLMLFYNGDQQAAEDYIKRQIAPTAY